MIPILTRMIKKALSLRTISVGGAFLFALICLGMCQPQAAKAALPITDANPMRIPQVGDYGLRIITSNLLEMTLITTGTTSGDASSLTNWNLVSGNSFTAPSTSDLQVFAGGNQVAISSIGFKRRPIYAPLSNYDLRIGNSLYLQLASPIANNAVVTVSNASGDLWNGSVQFTATNSPLRISPAIHVNQEGYMPNYNKWAEVGFYAGNLGELQIPAGLGFNLIEAASGAVVYSGTLSVRKDNGFSMTPAPYQAVLEADFSAFTTPGQYQVQVPTLGVSYPFFIDAGIAANFARTYELGLYHSRCGYSNTLPYTRFVKGECHEPPAAVPNMSSTWDEVNSVLQSMSSEFGPGAQVSSTPLLSSVNASLYPFVNTNPVDTHGGHHDAGDYSKYTVDVAQLCHFLLFSVDSLPGVAQLDNLGVPESGDGIPDVLQEALWEIDFLSRLQDTDGGFYFLVYPQQRQYEANLSLTGTNLGDPQCVFPKTTSATAAAVGALAEAGSSPYMKKYYPSNASNYLARAELGWQFLQNAISQYGRLGSYQAIQQYGNAYTNQDLLAWAAAALYAATGNTAYQQDLTNNFNPSDPNTFFWSWWRMYEGWGCAIRDYAFAARSGRLQQSQLDPNYLALCEAQIVACGDDNVNWANDNSYRNSLSDAYKSPFNAGWLFSVNQNFDVAVANVITNKPAYVQTMIGNMNYEAGCNPINMPYLTGIGARRQHQIVSQYADNQQRGLPPTGVPIGSVQSGFVYLAPYNSECSALTYPSDSAASASYAPYDRWADTFNTMTELVSWQQGRSLGAMAYLMALTGYTNQSWQYAVGTISGLPAVATNGVPFNVTLSCPGLDMSSATYTWEATAQDPTPGATWALTPHAAGSNWIEVEALLPDGRRVFATNQFDVISVSAPNSYLSTEYTPDSSMVALYHLDNNWNDSSAENQGALAVSGGAYLDAYNVSWMTTPTGSSMHCMNLGDAATIPIPSGDIYTPGSTTKISVEAMMYVNDFLGYNIENVDLLALGTQSDNWESTLELYYNEYNGPTFRAGGDLVSGATITSAITPGVWHHVSMSVDASSYTMEVDGTNIFSQATTALANWGINGAYHSLTIGNFDGWIDEVVVRNITTNPIVSTGGPSGTSTNPTVTLATLAGSYAAGAAIPLSATASIASGSIANVTFYANGTAIGSAAAAPYAISWNTVSAGTYSVTAVATSAGGISTTSAAQTVVVSAGATVVSAPSIYPNGGTFSGSTTVTLTAPAGAIVYYTTDGSTPTTSSSVYAAPFTLAGSATVNAVASLASVLSATASAQFTLTQAGGASTGGTNSNGALPTPWQQMDIGAVGEAGGGSGVNNTFTVQGSGADIWGTADAFHYVYVPVSGNGQIVAEVSGIQAGDPWAKAGVMFRQSLDAGSPHAYLLLSESNGVAFQDRLSESASSDEPNVVAGIAAPYWLKLARSGSVFSGSISSDGINWSSMGSITVNMNSNIYVGLAVTAHNATQICNATFGGVQVTGGNGVAILSSVLNADKTLTISFSGAANTTYYVQALSIFSSPAVWQTIATNVADSNGLWQYTETNVSSFQRRFYRAALP